MNFTEFEKENIRIINPRQRELHLVLVGEEHVSEFSNALKQIQKVFKDAKVVLKVSQYMPSIGHFVDL
jgi:hypothetical protein